MPASHNAEKYAEALVALGEATGALPRFEDDLAKTLDLIQGSAPIRSFLADPRIKPEGKITALEELLREHVHPVFLRFVLMLHDGGRLGEIGAVGDAFAERISGLRRKASGELVCARPISQELVDAIEREVGVLLHKDVRLRMRVDPSLLGGVRVQVGHSILDGTVDRLLEDFTHAILAPAAAKTPQ